MGVNAGASDLSLWTGLLDSPSLLLSFQAGVGVTVSAPRQLGGPTTGSGQVEWAKPALTTAHPSLPATWLLVTTESESPVPV